MVYFQRFFVATWLVPRETAAMSAHVLCTLHSHAPVYSLTSCKSCHIRRVHACLAVTCHLHLRQNARGLLRSTSVTLGWNGYRNKSQHIKLTLEKKILPSLLPGLEPAACRLQVGRSTAVLPALASFLPPMTILQFPT